jgi:hypothetical protein
MPHSAWSRAVAGAVLGVVLAAPAFALEREPVRTEVWSWLGNVWSKAVAAISWGIDPNGSASQEEPTGPGPSDDISLGIDPNG